jgi:hypothetical protein
VGEENGTEKNGISNHQLYPTFVPPLTARPPFCTQFQFPGWGVPFSARFSAPAVRGIEAGKRPKWPGIGKCRCNYSARGKYSADGLARRRRGIFPGGTFWR